ncbi:NAD(P)-dependent oxidoreductase [Acidocella sp.]|uniref:NAD(P)-dependent oxidoreductase n=1 Tax=Acidocella sp. TaxID=50710 RepID=UPI0026041AC2|nr:NAD(P)-dependent oxidoreductase [Acidocella sp.]
MSEQASVLGFIGLGVMGGGMCRNVVKKHNAPVHVFDMVADAVAAQVASGAIAASAVADVAKRAEIIFLSLPGGKQVAAVCDEIAQHARPGTIVVDLSTTAVADARVVAAKLAEFSIGFADAPVARTRQAAIDGTLSIMVGASEDLFARIAPLLGYMGSDVTLCGEVGCGQVVKLINNTLLFEQVAAIAEMMVVAERAGVTAEKLIEAVGLGSGNSFALQNHGKKAMAPREFPEKAFPSHYALKDLGYTLDLAAQMGVDARLGKLAATYYQAAVDAGIGAKYFPAIIELVDRK